MGFTKTLRAVSGAALAGALVFVSAPLASADQVREDQWPLNAFDAEAIWKISTGKGITIAVIDSGVDANHADLTGSVIEGKDFIDGGAPTPTASDTHGTHMASLIAGHGHGAGDSSGVMGLAPGAKILSIRDEGESEAGFAASIRYAVDHGASVINISQEGGKSVDENSETEAISYALNHDILIVAGSGNDGESAGYPASYPGVVAVGGVKNNGEIWEDSNFGPAVMLSAPATNIVFAAGETSSSQYGVGNGTSNSTAFVSAAAALLRAKFPDLTAGQIANRLIKTAGLPTSAKGLTLPDEKYGYGFIQPLAALKDNVPAGSKNGPLAVPTSEGATDASSGQATADTGMTEDELAAADRKQVILLTGLGVGALIVVGLVVLVIVKASRRKKNNRGGPGGPSAPSGYGGGPAPYGQPLPPQPNPYATPPQQTAPNYQQQPPSWGPQ